MKIWFCEDIGDDNSEIHGFATTKKKAEEIVAYNRGYTNFEDCIKDEWAKKAIKIDLLKPIAMTLLRG